MKLRSSSKLRLWMVEAVLGARDASNRKLSRALQFKGASRGTTRHLPLGLADELLRFPEREEGVKLEIAHLDRGRWANYPARSLKSMEAKRFAPVLPR